jgi:acyl carrier protein
MVSGCNRITEATGMNRISGRCAVDMPGIDWTRLGTSVSEVAMTVIGDQFRLYGRVLPLSTDLFADLGSQDDLEKLEVLMTMEELFNLRFDPTVSRSVTTVGDVVSLVQEGLRLQRASSLSPEKL